MITADKARRFTSRAQTKIKGSIDIASAMLKAEADLTRDIRRAADMGHYNIKFQTRNMAIANRLVEKLAENNYGTSLDAGDRIQTIYISWMPQGA